METKVANIELAKATIYSQGNFGMSIRKVEARNVRVEIRPYAQWANAVQITFTPKGARNARELTETTHATAVILEGWGHALSPDGVYAPGADRGRYRSCDSRWVSDFMNQLAAYVQATGAVVALNCVGYQVAEKTRNMTADRAAELGNTAWERAKRETAARGTARWEPTIALAKECGAMDPEEISHVLSALHEYR